MFELLAKTPEDIAADEVELGDIKIVLVPPPADKADDDCYSAKMCAQPVDLMCDFFRDVFPPKPKRECGRVKKRPPVARRALPAMSRRREHRSAPRRDGGARADRSSDDGPGGGDPPSHRKSEHGPRAEANPPQSVLRAPRVLDGRARQ